MKHHQTIQQAVCPHCWQTVAVTAGDTYPAHPKAGQRGAQAGQCPLSDQPLRPLFSLGQQVMTIGAIEALQQAGQNPLTFLNRHQVGDWGEVPTEDATLNVEAARHGFRLLSSYRLATGQKVWIITEHDRSVTTLLLPAEY